MSDSSTLDWISILGMHGLVSLSRSVLNQDALFILEVSSYGLIRLVLLDTFLVPQSVFKDDKL